MIVVSDTTPINYLVLIGCDNILYHLFGGLIIPEAVYEELTRPAAPDAVRRWAAQCPAWLDVRAAPSVSDAGLHQGELR